MSFRTSRPVAPSPFDIVRRCCLQQSGLPFAEALTAGQMEQASEAVGVSFGRDPQAVYTPPSTLWVSLLHSAQASEEWPCHLSFAAHLQMLTTTWLLAAIPVPVNPGDVALILQLKCKRTNRGTITGTQLFT